MKILSIYAAMTLTVVGIAQADMLTGFSVTNRYLGGAYEERLQELGTNKQTREFTPQWRATQETGLQRHCQYTLLARGEKDTSACGYTPRR